MESKQSPGEPERLIRSAHAFRGQCVTVRVDTVELPGGHITQREIVEHPGAVAIVPMRDDHTVVLIRQYRRAAQMHLLEIPAGTLEPDEDPMVCAQRELREETGLRAGTLTLLFSQFLAPGYSQEVLHVFLAEHLSADPLPGDLDESIETLELPLIDTPRMILDGRIRDAKTIAGLMTAIYLREHA